MIKMKKYICPNCGKELINLSNVKGCTEFYCDDCHLEYGLEYADLNARAKIKCLDVYINVVCPYEDYDDVVELEEVEYSIKCTLETGLFTIDSDGNWYDEDNKPVWR